jgi:4-amino-4-deoxy-L-arabinose transferase-like glycosyltransferase
MNGRGEKARAIIALAALALLALLVRLPAYAVNENVLGDAVARTELALQWSRTPHWISSFQDGALQFGPLHLYAVGAAFKVGLRKEDAGRLVSLLCGVLTVVPLAVLTRRLFGWRAAVWAGVGLACWGLHIQLSTTAASEALSLLLTVSSLSAFAAGWQERRTWPLVAAGLLLTLACAVRYDAWMLAPLLAALLASQEGERRAAVRRALLFSAACLPFPLAWLWGNWLEMGDPLHPIRYVERFHREWVQDGVALYGALGYRVHNLLFWPGSAVVTLTPVVGVLGMAGMGWAFRARRDVRWLLWVAWAPALYFTARSAVLLDLAPLARFTAAQVVLALPFVRPGLEAVVPAAWRKAVATAAAALLVGLTAGLAAFTWEPSTWAREMLVPVSPAVRNPPPVRRLLALWRAQHREPWQPLVIDEDRGGYDDLQIAFFADHPEDRLLRRRWPDYAQRRAFFPHPAWVVRCEGGALESDPDVEVRPGALRLGSDWFDEVPGLQDRCRLYRRRETGGPG